MSIAMGRQPRGSTLTVVLAGAVLAAAVLVTLVEMSSTNQQSTNQFVDSQGTFYAAQGATELARSEVWGTYQVRAMSDPNLDFGDYLKSRFNWIQVSSSATTTGSTSVYAATVTDWSNLKLGNRVITKLYLFYRERDTFFPGTTTPRQKTYDIAVQAEAQKDLGFATAAAQDSSFGTTSGSDLDRAQSAFANNVSQFMTVTMPPEYHGLDYGILTKNMQCMLCHLHVSSAQKTFNRDPSKFNSFPRVKVGSTDSLAIGSSADTWIDGSFYQRGNLEDDSTAALITGDQAAARLKAAQLNRNSSINQNSTLGTCTYVMDTNATGAPGTMPGINGNFYSAYPTATAAQSDGVLPNNDFPSPFPEIPHAADSNRDNHKVDPDELALALTDAISRNIPGAPGTIQGGVAMLIPPGTQYTDTALPSSGNPAAISQGASGNLILVGTKADPIQLDGKVVIDGDVIIRGYVKGTGQIFATGNIYIPGDVIYADKHTQVPVQNADGTTSTVWQESFGVTSSNKTNLLGLLAGKNIVVGDYLSQITNWNEGNVSSAASANPDFFLPRKFDGHNVVVEHGMADPGKILTFQNDQYLNPTNISKLPATYIAQDGKTYGTISQPNSTMVQLSQFNQREYVKTLKKLPDYGLGNPYNPANAAAYRVPNTPDNNPHDPYDDTYIPRYYSMYSYDANNPQKAPVYVFTEGWQQSPQVGGNGGAWNPATKKFDLIRHSSDPMGLTDLSTIPESVQSTTALQKKTVLNIHPDWIAPDTMMKIISSEELLRRSGTRRIDGLLYTSNALLAMERRLAQVYDPVTNTWSQQIARSGGNIQINGAAIAPDMAVLAPDGQFNLNYDGRIPGFAKLQPGLGINIVTSQMYDMVRKGFVKQNGALTTAAPGSATAGSSGSSGGGSNGGGSNGGGSNGSGSNGSGSNGGGSNGSGSNGSGSGSGSGSGGGSGGNLLTKLLTPFGL